MTPFKIVVAAAAAAFLAFSTGAQAQQKERSAQGNEARAGAKSDRIAKQDRQMLERLAQSDMAEIAAGKVAQEKASSPEVKEYGEHMVQDHSKMLEQGKKIAEAEGVKPPARTDRKHQAALKKLQGLSGEEFDRQYMAQMVKDHEEALKLAQKAAKEAKDPQLKQHAQKGAEHIKEHLAHARKLHDSLGASAGSSGRNASQKTRSKQDK